MPKKPKPEPEPEAPETAVFPESSAGPVTLTSIVKSLERIIEQGEQMKAAAGLQAARAAVMDIARLNGLLAERPTSTGPSLEELLAAIPDDDDHLDGEAGAAEA